MILRFNRAVSAAGTFGLTVITVEIRRIENIAPGFQGAWGSRGYVRV
jgi:hypothetical protein